jgi:hypothetical protein
MVKYDKNLKLREIKELLTFHNRAVSPSYRKTHFKRSYSQTLAQEHSFIEATSSSSRAPIAAVTDRLRQVIHDRDHDIMRG